MRPGDFRQNVLCETSSVLVSGADQQPDWIGLALAATRHISGCSPRQIDSCSASPLGGLRRKIKGYLVSLGWAAQPESTLTPGPRQEMRGASPVLATSDELLAQRVLHERALTSRAYRELRRYFEPKPHSVPAFALFFCVRLRISTSDRTESAAAQPVARRGS